LRDQDRGQGDYGAYGPPPPWWEEQRWREEALANRRGDGNSSTGFGPPAQGERFPQGNPRGQQQKNKGKKALGNTSGDGQQPAKGKAKQVPARTGAPAAGECFKCGRECHYQSDFSFDPLCVVCSGEGHTFANCPTRGKG
jgi:hypothetical protein